MVIAFSNCMAERGAQLVFAVVRIKIDDNSVRVIGG